MKDIKVNFIQSESQYALFLLKSMSWNEFQALAKSLTEEEISALNELISKAEALREAREGRNEI